MYVAVVVVVAVERKMAKKRLSSIRVCDCGEGLIPPKGGQREAEQAYCTLWFNE